MPLYLVTKRLIDIVVSTLALVCVSPVMLASMLLIKLEDFGPCFYSQTRIGKDGKPFTFYKLRSMSVRSDEERSQVVSGHEGIRFKDENDPRITRIGKYLRKFSLDEVPQLINVLRGDMTLVGPRPPIPEEVEQYSAYQRQRLNVQQGITCYWQVQGRSLIPFEEQVELDLEYIQKRSLIEDAKILFLTIPAVLSGRGAH